MTPNRMSLDRSEVDQLLETARHFELATRPKGRQRGLLGKASLELLAYFVAAASGRSAISGNRASLDPSIEYLVDELGRSRPTVIAALAALRQYGFIDWRSEATAGVGGRRNNYRLTMPPASVQRIAAQWIATLSANGGDGQ